MQSFAKSSKSFAEEPIAEPPNLTIQRASWN
jgi:hypothetical protein